jgi:prophage antirepressor-like protein
MDIIQKNFNGFDVRILLNSEKELFIAKDIAELLQYERPSKAVSDHCKKVVKLNELLNNPTLGQTEIYNLRRIFGTKWSSTQLIYEPDVWRLIIKSRVTKTYTK